MDTQEERLRTLKRESTRVLKRILQRHLDTETATDLDIEAMSRDTLLEAILAVEFRPMEVIGQVEFPAESTREPQEPTQPHSVAQNPVGDGEGPVDGAQAPTATTKAPRVTLTPEQRRLRRNASVKEWRAKNKERYAVYMKDWRAKKKAKPAGE